MPVVGRLVRRVAGDDTGSAVVWLLLILPTLWAFAGLVLDGGRVITARQEAANLAEQAARSAVDQLDVPDFRTAQQNGLAAQTQIDPDAARRAACAYTARAHPGAGCVTSIDGSGQVLVTVTIRTRTAVLASIGISHITVDGAGDARPAVGATQEVHG